MKMDAVVRVFLRIDGQDVEHVLLVREIETGRSTLPLEGDIVPDLGFPKGKAIKQLGKGGDARITMDGETSPQEKIGLVILEDEICLSNEAYKKQIAKLKGCGWN